MAFGTCRSNVSFTRDVELSLSLAECTQFPFLEILINMNEHSVESLLKKTNGKIQYKILNNTFLVKLPINLLLLINSSN